MPGETTRVTERRPDKERNMCLGGKGGDGKRVGSPRQSRTRRGRDRTAGPSRAAAAGRHLQQATIRVENQLKINSLFSSPGGDMEHALQSEMCAYLLARGRGWRRGRPSRYQAADPLPGQSPAADSPTTGAKSQRTRLALKRQPKRQSKHEASVQPQEITAPGSQHVSRNISAK